MLDLICTCILKVCFYDYNKAISVAEIRKVATLHRGSSSICWVLVRDLAIDMHFFGVIGFLWIKSTSYDGP